MRRSLSQMIDIRRQVSIGNDTNATPRSDMACKRVPNSVTLDDAQRYHLILRPIGTGGSSHVFKAYDSTTNRYVAVKIMDVRRMTPGDYANIKNETTILQILDHHPNIVQLIDSFDLGHLPPALAKVLRTIPKDPVASDTEPDDEELIPTYSRLLPYNVIQRKPYHVIVYSFSDNGDLFDYIEKKYDSDLSRALPEAEAKRIFLAVCRGIEHCHEKNVAHRDIKPENILLDKEGNTRLADFGLALKMPFPEFKASDAVGTVRTVAPEVLTGERYDAKRADIWSLGILLYFLLLGTFPYPTDDDDVFQMIEFYDKLWEQTDSIPLIGEDGEYSEALHDLVLKLLTFEPMDRPTIQHVLSHPWFA